MTNRYHLKSPVDVITTSLFIPQEYQQECIQEAYRLGDSMEQKTNVKALMSTYSVWEETDKFNLLLDKIKEITNLVHPIQDTRFEYRLDSAWSAIYKKGHYTQPHNHTPAQLAWVYYLKADRKSPLIFDDCNFKINPTNDMLVLFPGYLTHSVPQHKENTDRICLAGNFYLPLTS